MPSWEDFGMQALQGAAGGILGLTFGAMNDNRQYKQQERLQRLQIQGQKDMTDYNNMKQLEMWNATNSEAQMKHLKAAGLNPALMYGMGGGGGTTTGSANGSVTGGVAPAGGKENVAMAETMAQMGLLRAQKENIEADTKNKLADLPNKAAQTPNITASTQSILQGIENLKTLNEIQKWDAELKRIDTNVAEQTQGDKMGMIVSMAEHAASAAEMIERDNQIAEDTKQSKINEIRATAIGAVLKNQLTAAQTGKTVQEIENMQMEIGKWAIELQQKWKSLSLEERKTAIIERVGKFHSSQSQRTYDNILKGINTVMQGIKPGTTINQAPKETTINNY